MQNVEIHNKSWLNAYTKLYSAVYLKVKNADCSSEHEVNKYRNHIHRAQKELVEISISVAKDQYGSKCVDFTARHNAWQAVHFITQKLQEALDEALDSHCGVMAEDEDCDMFSTSEMNTCRNPKTTFKKVVDEISRDIIAHLTRDTAQMQRVNYDAKDSASESASESDALSNDFLRQRKVQPFVSNNVFSKKISQRSKRNFGGHAWNAVTDSAVASPAESPFAPQKESREYFEKHSHQYQQSAWHADNVFSTKTSQLPFGQLE